MFIAPTPFKGSSITRTSGPVKGYERQRWYSVLFLGILPDKDFFLGRGRLRDEHRTLGNPGPDHKAGKLGAPGPLGSQFNIAMFGTMAGGKPAFTWIDFPPIRL
jgi:hypothetical protein